MRHAPRVATSLAKVRELPEAPASDRQASRALPQGLINSVELLRQARRRTQQAARPKASAKRRSRAAAAWPREQASRLREPERIGAVKS
jgi:hypothetical protein